MMASRDRSISRGIRVFFLKRRLIVKMIIMSVIE